MTQVDRAGRSELHFAALEGRALEVEALLATGSDACVADRQGWTPLHFAAQSQHADIARILLRFGAEVDAVDEHGKSPLAVALFNVHDGDGEVIAVLLGAGADPELKNRAGVSPRDLAGLVANYDLSRHLPPPA